MDSDGENTLVINDLLSFVSCKLNILPRKRLFSITREFYPDEEILQAFNTLLECIPKSFCPSSPKKDILAEIAGIINRLPEEVSPIFVCQNVNNIPQINNKKTSSTLTFAGLNLTTKQQQELRGEHHNLQLQISNVANVVRQLSEQMEILTNKCDAYDRQSNLKKNVPSGKALKNLNSLQSPEKVQHLVEEVTGALIDTTRIRALRLQSEEDSPEGTSCSNSGSKKGKIVRMGKRKANEDFIRVSSSSELQFALSEGHTEEVLETAVKDCFIPLGRFDDCAVTIKKEPGLVEINGEEAGRSGRRPQRQKFSKFSDDFVVDFGNRAAKKAKK